MTKVDNPGPLGLLGFGMTTVLLNLHNANLISTTGSSGRLSSGVREVRSPCAWRWGAGFALESW